MMIGWATPLHQSSAIGRVSVGVTRALAQRGVKVDLLRTESAAFLGDPHLPSELNIVSLAGMSDYRALRDYDLLVYNLGNHAGFHLHGLEAAMQIPGICIFHDVLIFDLFLSWAVKRGEAGRVATMVDEIYGPGTYTPRKRAGCQDTAMTYPMLEWLAPHALGAVAHGRYYLARLAGSCAGPVRHIPLAYDLPAEIGPPRARSKGAPLRLTTMGHVNDNKLAAEVIAALGQSPQLRRHCTYRLAGLVSDDKRSALAGLAERLGVSLEMTGALSRSDLAREIEAADAMVCLRRPIMEGASASAIEAMLSGRPTIVLDHGFYQELPDELTLKIPPDFAVQDLQQRISWLLDHPEEARVLGQRAASWARDAFSFDRYAEAFLHLAEKAKEAEPLMRLGTQLGQELLALGAGIDDPSAIRIAQMATQLFCPGGELCRQI